MRRRVLAGARVREPIDDRVLDIARRGNVGENLSRRGEPLAALAVRRQAPVYLGFALVVTRYDRDEPKLFVRPRLKCSQPLLGIYSLPDLDGAVMFRLNEVDHVPRNRRGRR